MKKIFTTFLIFLTCGLLVNAQNYTQVVKGKILDSDSQIPIPGANIILLGSDPLIGTVTDQDGNYKFDKIPIGRHNFKVSFIGYEDSYLTEVLVGTGKEVVLNVKLKEAVTNLNEVVVYSKSNKMSSVNSMASISTQLLTIESTSRIAAGISDLGRTAQSYAGVSSADDENNELVIRGNSPRGMLWRMEGIEIPNPNHFTNGEGGSGGGICALSSQVLANTDFFTSAFPAEYGNALSGVFDLRLRQGNFDKNECAIQIGVLGTQIALEGPLFKGKESSYLINYRYSTLSVLKKINIDLSGGDIAPTFQDLSYNISLPTKKIGRFTLFGLGGNSNAGSTLLKDSLQWQYRSDKFADTEDHNLIITGLTHYFLLKDNKTYIKTAAVFSHTLNATHEDSLGYNYVTGLVEDNSFKYNTVGFNTFLNYKINSKNTLRTGVEFTNSWFNLFAKSYDFDEHILRTEIKTRGSANIYHSYLQWQLRFNPNVDINTGINFSYLAINDDYAIEPRFGLKWKLNDKNTFNFGAGLHSRSEPASIYLAEQKLMDGTIINPNKNLKMTKAVHFVVGYNWSITNNLRFKTEIYYQHLYDVPVDPSDSTGVICSLNYGSGFTTDKFANKGTGRNYGVEFTLEKSFSNNWYILATASLFESKYKMPNFKERNTLFNSRYIYNLATGKEFIVGKKKQNILGVNLRTIWRGGYRTNPIDFESSSLKQDEVRDYSKAFSTKASDYFRLDMGISYRKNNFKWSWVVSLDIQNVTNRLNVWDERYVRETNKIEQLYMVGLLPVLNYRVEF